MAVLAATTYSASDPNAQASYQALSQNVTANLDGQPGTQTISDIEADLANAQTTVSNAGTLNTQTQTTLQDMLQSIDGVNQNQIGEQILTLQNSLSASMSVTARLCAVEPGQFSRAGNRLGRFTRRLSASGKGGRRSRCSGFRPRAAARYLLRAARRLPRRRGKTETHSADPG